MLSAGDGLLARSGLGLDPCFMQEGSSLELRRDTEPIRCLLDGVNGETGAQPCSTQV